MVVGLIKTRFNRKLHSSACLQPQQITAVITASITLKAHVIFILLELVFLPTSRLLWPMPEVLASTNFSSVFLYLELSFSWNS
jgi:hypothetical protein